MNTAEFNSAVHQFNLLAEDLCAHLQDLLHLVSDKKLPPKIEAERLVEQLDKLRLTYDEAASFAKEHLSPEELPAEGCSIADYADAIANSRESMLAQNKERALDVLMRFISLESDNKAYSKALRPYKTEARKLIRNLDKLNDADKIASSIENYEALLAALAFDDLYSDAANSILERVGINYSGPVVVGVMKHFYYIGTAKYVPKVLLETNSTPTLPLSGEEVKTTSPQLSHYAEDGAVPASPQTSHNTEDGAVQVPEPQAPEPKILKPINKLKRGKSSASSFKNDMHKMAGRYREVRVILPLISIVGVMTKTQLYQFGVCLNLFKNDDKASDAVTVCVDELESKGYLACMQLGGDEEEPVLSGRGTISGKGFVYCLSRYASECISKKSIYLWMKNFWAVSFSTHHIYSRNGLDQNQVIEMMLFNNAVIKYLDTMKSVLSERDYRTVTHSMHNMRVSGSVAVIYDGRSYSCRVVFIQSNLTTCTDKTVLFIPLSDEDEGLVPSPVSSDIETLFVLRNDGIEKYSVIDGIPSFEKKTRDKVIPLGGGNIPLNNDNQAEDEAVHFDEDGSIDSESVPVDDNTISETASVSPAVIEDTALYTVINRNSVPSDPEFCAITFALLRRPSSSLSLKSIITETVLFALGSGMNNNRPDASHLASQLRLAAHLMINESSYSSVNMTSTFADMGTDNKALLLSAYMFAMITPAEEFDYMLRNQLDGLFANYELYFDRYTAFKPLFNKLLTVQDVIPAGFASSIMTENSTHPYDVPVETLRKKAREYLIVQVPNVRMTTLPELYRECFGPKSDLYECMKIIAENKTDPRSIDIVEAALSDYCDLQFRIDMKKVEERLDSAWRKVNGKNKFDLQYKARPKAIRQLTMRIELMLEWRERVDSLSDNHTDIERLNTLRQEILSLIESTQNDSSWHKDEDANILAWMLYYMRGILNGGIQHLELYSDLLADGIIPLDDDGLPVIDRSTSEIRYYEFWRNVLRHVSSPKKSFDDVKAEILGDVIDGSDDMKDNLHQLEMIGKLLGKSEDDYIITDAQKKEAAVSADEYTTRFKESLELAYTYGQINEIEKETLLDIIAVYKDAFYESLDFANWRRFLEALRMQVNDFMTGRTAELSVKLSRRLESNPDSTMLKEAERLLTEAKNLAVAEEYINRYDAGEVEIDSSGSALNDVDYFEDFLSDDKFGRLFGECHRNNGRALKTFAWSFIEKNLPSEWTSRHKDNSKTMILSWPSRKATMNDEQVKTLFTCLGFDVVKVSKVSGNKEEMYQISARPTPKNKADYSHPVSAFGTQLKAPVNAIILYGNYTEKQLVDTITSLNLGGIAVVLIDRPLEAAVRRHIGEIFHTQTSGQNPFLLIDQVLFMYLAMHQVTERLPALLKCTLPYTSYQPFVRDGGSTSDEMFCGRTQELATLIDPNGACVVYGGRQLGKTALLERVENLCSKPEAKAFAVYTSIIHIISESEVVSVLVSEIAKKTDGKISLKKCKTIKDMCTKLSAMFRDKKITSMHLLIDESDDFLAAIAEQKYAPLQPLVDLKRETTNSFKFVIAGLHNVCRAKNATTGNGIFGQLGTPLCIKPLSPVDALRLLSRPLSYLGFRTDRSPHMETILTNTNYYPGILQFFGYMLVQNLTAQYKKYYSAANGNPPFELSAEQLGSVMNSSDLNKSIKDKFRWTLELDPRYFMTARCIAMLYHYNEEDRSSGVWRGFSVEEIMNVARDYEIHCLKNETLESCRILCDEMVDMGILSQPESGLYKLRRSSFVDIIGENIDVVERDIRSNNTEA